MKDSALRLQDKTILLTGPFNGTTQAILRTLTEFGADVGYVCEHGQYANKYVDGVNEAREVHPQYGRAAHFALPLGDEKQIQEALGRVAESIGRMDALIDASPLAWNTKTDADRATALCLTLAEKSIPFLLAKQRGRLVYVYEDFSLDPLSEEHPAPGTREKLTVMIETLAKRHRQQNITCNALAIGVTDDFLLRNFPKGASLKKSFTDLQSKFNEIKLVEFHDIGLGASYLTSALSASLTGQTLRLTHGAHLA